MAAFKKLGALALLPLIGACDFSGDFLFPGAIEGVPGVLHISAEDGISPVEPAVINSPEDAQAATIFAEVGPTGDANPAGVTFNFVGNGGAVCAFVDPELVFWNQSVSAVDFSNRRWRQPDNPFDDGDLDLQAGLSVYYTGSEGERLGNFTVRYEDTLGNEIPVDLVACTIRSDLDPTLTTPHSGRGAPEYCTIFNTQPGISYTVALEVFSTPPDDDRLGFGILLAEGTCPDLITAATAGGGLGGLPTHEECVIRGEALVPVEGQGALYRGYQADQEWPGSINFEETFCYDRINQYCNQERELKAEQGDGCDYSTVSAPENRCFCGDPATTPTTGLGTY